MNEYLYVGMSSGPIFELMQYARATKELWMSSYMFSRYAQHMVHLLYTNFDDAAWHFTLLSPNVTKEESERANPMSGNDTANDMRVGLYSDRIFFRVITDDQHTKEIVKAIVDKVILSAKEMLSQVVCSITGSDLEECRRIIHAVVYTCAIYREAPVLPLSDMNSALDELELFAGDRPDETEGSTDLFANFFDKEKLVPSRCQWIKDAFLRGADLSQVAGVNRQLDSYYASQASKYYAVVVADGDGVGTVLGSADSDPLVQNISRALLRYAQSASKAVIDYSENAYPVYFGGDDMEFFAPLYSEKSGRTIWTLLDRLQDTFEKGESSVCAIDKCENCSVSVAVNIVYYQYPLSRAIAETHDMLWEAKNATAFVNPICGAKPDTKDCVHVQLRKHSGQTSRFLVTRRTHSDASPWDAVKEYFSLPQQSTLVHNIHHRLLLQKYVLLALLQENNYETRLNSWLKVMQEEYPVSDDYINQLAKLICCMWEQRRTQCRNEEDEDKTKIERIDFLQDLDGVFRVGELLYTFHKAKKAGNKKEAEEKQ